MSQLKQNQLTDVEIADSNWKSLYKFGGAAALIVAVLFPIEIIVMIAYPLPSTVIGYFTLFQSNRLIGLLDLYLLEIPAYALFVPMFLALYAALRRANESYMALATTLAIIGIAVFLATNNPFSCFPSATNTRLRQQTHRDLCFWQQGRRCLLIRTSALSRVSTWGFSSCPLPV